MSIYIPTCNSQYLQTHKDTTCSPKDHSSLAWCVGGKQPYRDFQWAWLLLSPSLYLTEEPLSR